MTAKVHGVFGDGELTDEHATSSYGRPVLVVAGVAYGPDDQIECGCGEDTWREPAREAVRRAILGTPTLSDYDSPETVTVDDGFGEMQVAAATDITRWQSDCIEMHKLRDRFVRR